MSSSLQKYENVFITKYPQKANIVPTYLDQKNKLITSNKHLIYCSLTFITALQRWLMGVGEGVTSSSLEIVGDVPLLEKLGVQEILLTHFPPP